MPRAREDNFCGLYCHKLSAITLVTNAKSSLLEWSGKTVLWCKTGNGKPLVFVLVILALFTVLHPHCSNLAASRRVRHLLGRWSWCTTISVLARSGQTGGKLSKRTLLLALSSLPSLGSGMTARMQQRPSVAASDPAPPLCWTQENEHLGGQKRKTQSINSKEN